MGIKREEKALYEFKQIIDDLVSLLRHSTDVETVYIVWVNRSRRQFVMEASSTSVSHVMFPDRVDFNDHFLNDYREIENLIQFDVSRTDLSHYYHDTLPRLCP